MPTTAKRRTLTFASLDEVMPEVDRLLAGHTTVGHWTLGQICNHLTKAITGSVEGFTFRAPWFVRSVVAPLVLRNILKSGRMPEGVKVNAELLPGVSGLDARAEAEALRASLRLLAAHNGPFADHPFFGRLTRAQVERLQCVHCAHHLSFVLPAAPS